MFVRLKKVAASERSYQYVQVVENRREAGHVRQHLVASLGRLDRLQAEGDLQRIIEGLVKLAPQVRLVKAQREGSLAAETDRNGASGGVGSYAVQIARSFGAEVTAVCSTKNLDLARSLGADHIIDYTREEFTRDGQQYDLILAANGYHPLSDYRRALKPGGIYVGTGGSMAQTFQAMLQGPIVSMTGNKTMSNMLLKPNRDDLLVMKDLIEAGKVVPVIDRSYPLSHVADALRYIGEGHARGKVVMTVAQNN